LSEAQNAAVEAYIRLGSVRKAAAELGKAYSGVHELIVRWQTKALNEGTIPAGYKLIGMSTTRDKDGNVLRTTEAVGVDKLMDGPPIVLDAPISRMTSVVAGGVVERQYIQQVVKDEEKAKLWKAYAEELLKPVLYMPVRDIVGPEPLVAAKDQLAVYPIGDYHVGMMAWGAETRSDNHDLKTSEVLLQEAAETLMDAAPPCETAVLAFMGDFVHFDSFRPETPMHKHLLDTDSRFGKVGTTAMRVVRHVIAAARRRHRHVHVIWLRGNHDESVAELIKMFLGMFYEGEQGITVDTGPSYFSFYEFGKNLMGFAHGDKLKPARMPMVMANDMAEAWGRCPERIIFTGHVHHESRSDEYGVALETVPVIIPNDAYATNAGYRSRRAMQVIIFDREYGELERHTYNPARYYRGR
jgi:hypothetical protein